MTLADSFDQQAKALTNTLKQTESELLEILIQMKRKRLFAELGYSGVNRPRYHAATLRT